MNTMEQERLYSLRAASRTFKLSYQELRFAVDRGELPALVGGGEKLKHQFVTRSALDAWLKELGRDATSEPEEA